MQYIGGIYYLCDVDMMKEHKSLLYIGKHFFHILNFFYYECNN